MNTERLNQILIFFSFSGKLIKCLFPKSRVWFLPHHLQASEIFWFRLSGFLLSRTRLLTSEASKILSLFNDSILLYSTVEIKRAENCSTAKFSYPGVFFFLDTTVIPLLSPNCVGTRKHTVLVYFSQGLTASILLRGMLLRDIGLTQSKLRRRYSSQ